MVSVLRESFVHFCFFFLLILASKTSYSSIEIIREIKLRPAEDLQASFEKGKPSIRARTIKRAYEALVRGKNTEALQLASKVLKDDLFSDFGYWISASSSRQQSQQWIDKKKYGLALKFALKAISLSLQIENKNPYSPFLKTLPKDMAQAEFLAGVSYWGLKQWLDSQKYFSTSLQRLHLQNSLSLVETQKAQYFLEACSHKPTPLCQAWVQRLALLLPDRDFLNRVEKRFPFISERKKIVRPVSKSSIPYKSPDLDQQAFDAAMQSYSSAKYADASKNFQEFLNRFPRSSHRYRARYWLAKSLSLQDEKEKAQQVYLGLQMESPLTYYGFLASHETGRSIESMIGADLPMATNQDPALLPQEVIHLKRAQELITEKAYSLVHFELRDLKAREGLSSPFLVYLAMLNYKSKNFGNVFQIAGELIQRGYDGIVSSFGLRMVFPVHFLNVINKHSEANLIDPVLVLSLIKQESAFVEDANSSAGAMGLMQVMPLTASDTDPEVKVPHLLEAEHNVRIGTKYLGKLLKKYNGNIVFALAGYNAGPAAVDRWLKGSEKKQDMLEFIESIPYRETREYVAAIIRNYYWYSRKLSGESKKSLNYFWNIYGPPETPAKLPSDQEIKLRTGNA